MALLKTPIIDLKKEIFMAPDFQLLGTDNNLYSLHDFKDADAILTMFICNHCPFVLGIIDDLVKQLKTLQNNYKFKILAICSNDSDEYPADSFKNMKIFSTEHSFSFPYLHDPEQKLAKAYRAVCTPDFFVFNKKLILKYRGRFQATDTKENELFNAISLISTNKEIDSKQHPSMGCSIKWLNK